MATVKGALKTAVVVLVVLAAWHYVAPTNLKAYTGTV
jgi:hypothetical protein